jgi:hypothetical protein
VLYAGRHRKSAAPVPDNWRRGYLQRFRAARPLADETRADHRGKPAVHVPRSY